MAETKQAKAERKAPEAPTTQEAQNDEFFAGKSDHRSLRSKTKKEYQTNPSGEGAVCFTSSIKKLMYSLYREGAEKDGKRTYQKVPIMFDNFNFWTNNPAIIKALRSAPNFGGSADNDFQDGNVGHEDGGQPLFWEGGVPAWQLEKERLRANEYSRTPGAHEATGEKL